MGTIRHHCIVITCGLIENADKVFNQAVKLFGTEMVSYQKTLYYTIFIGPDGSKEEWDTSNENDEKRAEMKLWLIENKITNWFEYAYGGCQEVNGHHNREIYCSANRRYQG